MELRGIEPLIPCISFTRPRLRDLHPGSALQLSIAPARFARGARRLPGTVTSATVRGQRPPREVYKTSGGWLARGLPTEASRGDAPGR